MISTSGLAGAARGQVRAQKGSDVADFIEGDAAPQASIFVDMIQYFLKFATSAAAMVLIGPMERALTRRIPSGPRLNMR